MIKITILVFATGADKRSANTKVRATDRRVGRCTAGRLRRLAIADAQQALNQLGVDHLHATLGTFNVAAKKIMTHRQDQIDQRRANANQFRRERNRRGQRWSERVDGLGVVSHATAHAANQQKNQRQKASPPLRASPSASMPFLYVSHGSTTQGGVIARDPTGLVSDQRRSDLKCQRTKETALPNAWLLDLAQGDKLFRPSRPWSDRHRPFSTRLPRAN